MSLNRINYFSLTALLLMIALSAPILSHAAEVTVTWTFATNNMNGTPITDLAGGKVYYGTASSNYTHVIDVPGGEPGQTKSFTVSNLVAETTYYLNGTAYNFAGLESDFCTEVAKVAHEGDTVTTQGPKPKEATYSPPGISTNIPPDFNPTNRFLLNRKFGQQ